MMPIHIHLFCTVPVPGVDVRDEILPSAAPGVAWCLRLDTAPERPELLSLFEDEAERPPIEAEKSVLHVSGGPFNLAYAMLLHSAFKRQLALAPRLLAPRYHVLLTPGLLALDYETDAGPLRPHAGDAISPNRLASLGLDASATTLPLVAWRDPPGVPSAHREIERLATLRPQIDFLADLLLPSDRVRAGPRMG